jgi:hypothetical protein
MKQYVPKGMPEGMWFKVVGYGETVKNSKNDEGKAQSYNVVYFYFIHNKKLMRVNAQNVEVEIDT